MRFIRSLSYLCIFLLVLLATGCATEERAETGVPEGWEASDDRWWRTGFDTTGVFRNLETFADMGSSGGGLTFVANAQMTTHPGGLQEQFDRRVQRSLIRLYRNKPELVDSLFERYVRPTLQDKADADNMNRKVDEFQRKGYGILRNHFQEPQTALVLGKDVEVPYPDSLRQKQVTGAVKTQVYLNKEGEPMAIMLLEGVHPVLDAIGMRATTQMRWRPAYRIRNGNWIPIPAWTRYNLRFRIE